MYQSARKVLLKSGIAAVPSTESSKSSVSFLSHLSPRGFGQLLAASPDIGHAVTIPTQSACCLVPKRIAVSPSGLLIYLGDNRAITFLLSKPQSQDLATLHHAIILSRPGRAYGLTVLYLWLVCAPLALGLGFLRQSGALQVCFEPVANCLSHTAKSVRYHSFLAAILW